MGGTGWPNSSSVEVYRCSFSVPTPLLHLVFTNLPGYLRTHASVGQERGFRAEEVDPGSEGQTQWRFGGAMSCSCGTSFASDNYVCALAVCITCPLPFSLCSDETGERAGARNKRHIQTAEETKGALRKSVRNALGLGCRTCGKDSRVRL